MGGRMAANCIAAGHHLSVWNRDVGKASALVARGARLPDSPAEAVEGAAVVFTMLTDPAAVAAVAFGATGFAERLTPGQLWLDTSTVDPAFAKTCAARAARAGFGYADAPVAGTKGPAEAGELLFLVGAPAERVAVAEPLLGAMGEKTLYLGAPGAGASVKLLVNGLLAQGTLAFAEAVHLGVGLGLPRETVFDVLLATPVAAPFLSSVRSKTEGDDYGVNFPLEHMHKDLHLAASAAYGVGRPAPSLNAAKEVYALARARGFAGEDFTAIYRWLAGTGSV